MKRRSTIKISEHALDEADPFEKVRMFLEKQDLQAINEEEKDQKKHKNKKDKGKKLNSIPT